MQESRNYLAVLTCLYSFFYKLRIKTIKIDMYYLLVTAESLHSPLKNIKKDNSFGYSKRLR